MCGGAFGSIQTHSGFKHHALSESHLGGLTRGYDCITA